MFDSQTAQIILRLLLALVLGALIGYERETHHKPAGFRTHILVCVGSALFTIVSIFGFGDITFQGDGGIAVRDASRVAAQIVVGIGFLAAGIIMQNRDSDGNASVKGLTTAASVWVVAAMGMAAGAGMIMVAIASAVLLWIILAVLDKVEDSWIKRWQEVRLVTLTKTEPQTIVNVLKSVADRKAIIQEMDVKHKKDEKSEITLSLVLTPNTKREEVVADLLKIAGVEEAKID